MLTSLLTIQILGAVLVVAALFLEVWRSRRSAQIIRNWADANGYRVLESRLMLFWTGPFFWRKSGQQQVFRVTVRDKTGTTQTTWIRCGHWWLGLVSSEIKVHWDN